MKIISFEWDESKNLANQKKHGISFEEAKTVFYDEAARKATKNETLKYTKVK